MIKIDSPSDFHKVYIKYNRLIKSIAFRMLGEPFVDDLLQDCLTKAWSQKRAFQNDDEVKNWLCKIAVNLCIDRLRKKQVRSGTESVEDVDIYGTENHYESQITKIVSEALRTLKEDFRAAFVLVALEGFTTKEASELLKTNENTIRTRIHRARLDLKSYLEAKGVRYE